MTDHPTEPVNEPQDGPQAAEDPTVKAWTEAAMAQEAQAAAEAALAHLQRRVVALNVEVRHRDARIAELERELAQAQVPHSGDSEG